MSKKDFSGGLDSLLGGKDPKPRQANPKAKPKTASKGKAKPKETRPPEARATFIIKEETLTKLKAMAYWERVLIKDIINQALETHVKKYEKNNGKIKPIPGR